MGILTEPSTVALLSIVAVTLLLLLRTSRKFYQHERQLGCGEVTSEDVSWIDFLGITKLVEFARHFQHKTALEYTDQLFTRYGSTYMSKILGYRIHFTCDPKNIKHILSTGFADYDSSKLRGPLFNPITPHGIFTVDGPDWRAMRDQLRTQLSNNRGICDFAMFERQFQILLQHVPSNGQKFDIQASFISLAIDIQSEFALGDSISNLHPSPAPAKKHFAEDLHVIKETIVRDGFRGPLRHLSSKLEFRQSCVRARRFVMGYAEREMAKHSAVKMQTSDQGYYFMRGLCDRGADAAQLANQTLSILLANDSIATTLSGIFFLLSQHKWVVSRLRQSILDEIGSDLPTYDQLTKLVYLRYVIQESMRLFPAAPLNARTANKHTVLPFGGGPDGKQPILIRQGDVLVFSSWSSHRSEENFGAKPEEFRPERWEKLKGDVPGFIPFNKGPRICPGQNYAMVVVSYIVARLMQTFSTVTDYNPGPWVERISMTLENDNGVLVGLS
ncbi:cytochrome P450 monooxygenase afumB [Aspergillus homomorphus CBS 101889]|uniref:Putative cytochrome P450 oxidoreductase/alkane hydroxylase n=1 Tax=Aspergillus homomorphus (strain CBS 101889) TaxID=1450537 RepID=A0A395HWI8_ASPHC|nr:putative cytochrome P450 oxidoreductase/alkane hydroxylase [Aspergillus homomorphus CBS 101889]RAL11208.1 putative cytochrome P450 oxidoreductase/alkane hydroxylase [Aspergillus homomorphus CBS 101889]